VSAATPSGHYGAPEVDYSLRVAVLSPPAIHRQRLNNKSMDLRRRSRYDDDDAEIEKQLNGQGDDKPTEASSRGSSRTCRCTLRYSVFSCFFSFFGK
jgi:hypothetical protein